MCGITGIIRLQNGTVFPDNIANMTKALSHRGPDDIGHVLIDGEKAPIEFTGIDDLGLQRNELSSYGIGFGHTRLSVIDLSQNGHQPMCNHDRSIWITYNGEIYNYKEIQTELKLSGYVFKSNSDTEVIIAAYEEWGLSCLNKFNGMFAFGLWDSRIKTLFLARDRFGEKPLYYYKNDFEFCFASEIKAILINKNCTSEVDLTSLYNYIGLLYVPGRNSIWKNIKSVPPGCYLKLKNGEVHIEKYWEIKPNRIISLKRCTDEKYLVERINEGLKQAVKYRMISDVPMGSFLSGGVDSSCITLLMSQLTSEKVKTFSLGFKEEDPLIFDELPYARRVAQHLGTDHHEFVISYNDILKELPAAICCFDEPFAGALPQYYLSRLAREYVTVCLGGIGGDEIFGDYGRLSMFRKTFGNRFMLNWLCPDKIKHFLKKETLGQYYFNKFSIFSEEHKKEIFAEEVLKKVEWDRTVIANLNNLLNKSLSDPLDICSLADMATQLEGEYLNYTDKLSMRFALEMRAPFLDHKLVEFVFSIPSYARIKENNLKYLLCEAFGSHLPLEVFTRKKGGFSLPYTSWINNELKPVIMEYLSERSVKKRGILNSGRITSILKEHYLQGIDRTYRIWSLFILELWYRLYIDRQKISFESLVDNCAN